LRSLAWADQWRFRFRRLFCSRFFTVLFYGVKKFRGKTSQFCVTLRELPNDETPSVSHAVQHRENTRKNSFLN
jgi:hypothetical protein